jgi:hypothetical protein
MLISSHQRRGKDQFCSGEKSPGRRFSLELLAKFKDE